MTKLLLGDCLERLTELPENSIDSIVTDPPYGLSFMGKSWDYDVPGQNIWEECLRVLKPGGHLLSFFGTRTYHRGVCRIEDAGFEIRDQIMWIYGSGFPKSTDVSKRIDKEAGAEREVVGPKVYANGSKTRATGGKADKIHVVGANSGETLPSTPEAIQWQGWGTALKPANEPIVVARKPLEKGLTVAQNVLKWGTGALNIDGSRIAGEYKNQGGGSFATGKFANSNVSNTEKDGLLKIEGTTTQGRWPANVIFDEEAAETLPLDSQGESVSRYFYVAKASKAERNAGLEGVVSKKQGARPKSADASGKFPDHDHRETGGNNHPTVKPLKLGTYLQNLVTPPGGVTLDPFMGSGSFGVSAKAAGFEFIGIERDEAYFEIAKKRIDAVLT